MFNFIQNLINFPPVRAVKIQQIQLFHSLFTQVKADDLVQVSNLSAFYSKPIGVIVSLNFS